MVLVVLLLSLWSGGVLAVEYPFIILPGGTSPLSDFGQQLESAINRSAQTIGQTNAQNGQTYTQSAYIQAQTNNSIVMIDGEKMAFEAYTIDGYNYFKLRDLAMALNGSKKQFDVTWDGSKNAINLLTNQAYSVAGGELLPSGQTQNQNAIAATSNLYIDGNEITLTAYTINNYTYFKLRDVGQAINFGVSWDGSANTIRIDTASDYRSE
jgi:Copper amine oxidase N-terminal domain